MRLATASQSKPENGKLSTKITKAKSRRLYDCMDAGGRQKTAPAFSAFATSLWFSNAGAVAEATRNNSKCCVDLVIHRLAGNHVANRHPSDVTIVGATGRSPFMPLSENINPD
jgi:hypothetical protein